MKLIDEYESSYAFCRGVWIAFSIHICFIIKWCLNDICACMIEQIGFYLAFDIFAVFLFYVRSYRLYLAWIKNVYEQCERLQKDEIESSTCKRNNATNS